MSTPVRLRVGIPDSSLRWRVYGRTPYGRKKVRFRSGPGILSLGFDFDGCPQVNDLAGTFNFAGVMALQLGGGSGLLGLAPLLFIFAIFYFLLIMPQQRKQKKWQAMLSQLKTGDKVVTSGGLRGTIISLKDDAVTVRVPPDNLKLEVSRASVVSVATAEEAK